MKNNIYSFLFIFFKLFCFFILSKAEQFNFDVTEILENGNIIKGLKRECKIDDEFNLRKYFYI